MADSSNPSKGGKQDKPDQPEQSSPSAKHEVNPEAKDHWRKGNSFFEESKFDDALKEFSEAIEIDSKYADAYFNRALTNRMLKNFDSAKRDLDIVMELQPESADAPLLVGDMAEVNDDYIGARYWYEKSLKINPDYAEAKARLEKIDSLMHVNSNPKISEAQVATQKYSQPQKPSEQQSGDVIEDGQIKSLALYKSEIKFDSVIGLDKVKKYLAENVVLAMKQPQLFRKYGKKMGLGLILYGPPGVGKTHIVNAVAGEANANVYIARINQIVDMYTGNTEKNIHMMFKLAREHTPIIMVFDELDALTPKRGAGGGASDNSALRLAVNAFLTEMSGLEKNPEGIFVIGTTNTPWDIDPAMKRSGRFGDRIYLTVPTYKDRKKLFEFYTRKTPKNRLSYGRLARATMGYSPADIESICDKATMKPLLHEYAKQRGRNLNMSDIMSILKDKEASGSSLDEWYEMVKKDVITKTETQTVDGKKQEIVKEGKLDAQEKVAYKAMVNDIKKNTSPRRIRLKKFMRWWAIHLF